MNQMDQNRCFKIVLAAIIAAVAGCVGGYLYFYGFFLHHTVYWIIFGISAMFGLLLTISTVAEREHSFMRCICAYLGCLITGILVTLVLSIIGVGLPVLIHCISHAILFGLTVAFGMFTLLIVAMFIWCAYSVCHPRRENNCNCGCGC